MLSQTAEYALRAIVFLAQHDEGQPTSAIAEGTQVPPSYLSKVLQGLQRGDLVQGRRGAGGGFVLARTASHIRVLDVVDAVDPIARIRKCPLGNPAHKNGLCPLHRRLDDAMALVEQTFAATSIDELVAEPASTPPLCPARAARARRP